MWRACSRVATVALTISAVWWSVAAGAAESLVPDSARVDQIAAWLPERPRGVGPTIDDRGAWQAVAAAPRFRDVVDRAERLMSQPIPELTDELYLDFSRTGNRSRCQRVISQRHSRMPLLVLAECLDRRGRFLPAIEEAIREVCSEKTWVLPAHDRGLDNFRGRVHEIDLRVANEAWNLATADYWLGDQLSEQTRRLIREQLQRRAFDPFVQAIRRGQPRLWWLRGTNNWNAVCLAGVTGSALAMIDSRQRRAFFVAAAEKSIQNFLQGFTDDGYCSEGVGYFNYGFGHYVMLAETLHQATGGKLDLLADAKVERIARFARRMEIVPGVYPAFADCTVGTRPDTRLMAFLSRRFGWGLAEVEREGLLLAAGPSTRLFALGLFGAPNSATAIPPAAEAAPQPPRDWFPEAGVLIARPAPGRQSALAVALKGGHNAEHHNHNDVGTFLVALGGQTPLVDPGAEVYTARTFSSRRYESGVLNSFGHPVPRVAGQLQRTGRAAAADVLQTEFTDARDRVVLDLRAAYDCPQLKKLQRTFVFSREDRGSLTVTDEVELEDPHDFGTALITFSKWNRLAPDRLRVGEKAGAVQVGIEVVGGDYRIHAEEIREDVRGGRVPTRLGIDLAAPVREARITLSVVPAPADAGK